MTRLVDSIRASLQLGATSHVAIRARAFLDLPQFHLFTRDYVRRCCDFVEHMTKDVLAERLGLDVHGRPLGAVVSRLGQLREAADLLPSRLVGGLREFNRVVYNPAKHERFSQGLCIAWPTQRP
jgi:hypothetical protein